MFDMSGFERMTNEECMDRFGWGYEGRDGGDAYHGFAGDVEVFMNEMAEGVGDDANVFACELYDAEGGMLAEGYGETFADALHAALVMAAGADAMEEGNSEDAVNACAFGAFQLLYGRMPEHDADMDEMDELLAHAIAYVRAHAAAAGFEWEDAWA